VKKIEPRTGKIGRADHLTLNRETYRRRRNCKIIPDGMNDKPPSEVGVANFVAVLFVRNTSITFPLVILILQMTIHSNQQICKLDIL